jgi:diguanylate cyclase (GGDEF)-like protein
MIHKKQKKSNPILTVQLIVIITVLIATSSVYYTAYSLFNNTIMNDLRERADNLKEYVQGAITTKTFEDSDGAFFEETREELSRFREVAHIRHLYIATVDESGGVNIVMNSLDDREPTYALSDEMAADLRRSLESGEVVHSSEIYDTGWGNVYAIYWPVFDQENVILGAVGMEFDVTSIYNSYREALIYSGVISAGLILLFCLVAYLSLMKMKEPYYKKLAFTDPLTGLENRMAFESQLLQCEEMIAKNRNITFMVFDLNNLKKVNDTLGHKLGDLYIKNTALTIAQLLKGKGDVYRIGGDEFAAIVVDWPEEKVDVLLDIFRNEKRQVIKGFPFSCAFGASTFKHGADNNLRDVIDRADNEMYGEKKKQKEM